MVITHAMQTQTLAEVRVNFENANENTNSVGFISRLIIEWKREGKYFDILILTTLKVFRQLYCAGL